MREGTLSGIFDVSYAISAFLSQSNHPTYIPFKVLIRFGSPQIMGRSFIP